MSFVIWLKFRLSTINSQAWHYKLVDGLWRRSKGYKACSYWWFYLPASMIFVGAIYTLLFPFVLTILSIIGIVGWCLGIAPRRIFFGQGDAPIDFYPYGYSPLTKTTRKLRWRHAVIPALVLAIVTRDYTWPEPATIGRVTAMGVAVIMVLMMIGALVKWRRNELSQWWDRTCPPLVVKQPQ